MAQCFLTYTLSGGEIDTQSVTAFPRLPAPPPKAIDAITGGTREVRRRTGRGRREDSAEKGRSSLSHFID